MKKSGLADSPFFLPPQAKNEDLTPPLAELPAQKDKFKQIKKNKGQKSEQSHNDDAVVSRYHDTTVPRVHGVMVELLRKSVREFGKEAATHRFTIGEKKEISDLIYTYKNRGIKTSENEITRIAVNYLLINYQENGENSILHKIIEALNG